MSTFGIVLTFALVNNIVLSQLLGVCPCIGGERRISGAVALGIASVFLMTAAALSTWSIRQLVLSPAHLEYLQTPAFIVAVFLIAELAELLLRKAAPDSLRSMGFSPSSMGVNCAVLGIALIAARDAFGPLESLTAGFAAGLGFLSAYVLISAIAERLDQEKIPRALRGAPILLISTGLVAMAFLAFDEAFVRNLVG